MPRRKIGLWLVLMCTTSLLAQDLDNLQIHGFATQGFLFSSNNNYLTMKSSEASLQWAEGAISFNDTVTDKLRVGVQIHMYQMGQIGGPNLMVDWASGDYKLNDNFGIRAGKIKLPLGLFNDSQDVDSLFVWVLLPQANYPDDNRDFDLAVLGGEMYGRVSLGSGGKLCYRGYAGESRLDANGGYMRQLTQSGFTFPDPPSGKAFGADVRWATPWKGLTLGTSTERQGLDGAGPEGTVHAAPGFLTAYYAEWRKGKLYVAGEYWRLPVNIILQAGPMIAGQRIDQRSWYPMVSYGVSKKLQVGAYYSHYINKAGDTALAENYSKDMVISGRYNFNGNFYTKLEGHFLRGTGIGYDASTNPNGVHSDTNMLAARIGFSF